MGWSTLRRKRNSIPSLRVWGQNFDLCLPSPVELPDLRAGAAGANCSVPANCEALFRRLVGKNSQFSNSATKLVVTALSPRHTEKKEAYGSNRPRTQQLICRTPTLLSFGSFSTGCSQSSFTWSLVFLQHVLLHCLSTWFHFLMEARNSSTRSHN